MNDSLMNKFLNYLNENLPKGYWAEKSKNEIVIQNQGGYVYMFYRQEIEENYDLCCSLTNTILDLTK